jgi:hypothetical protein
LTGGSVENDPVGSDLDLDLNHDHDHDPMVDLNHGVMGFMGLNFSIAYLT